jgi:hypothetical protein
MTQLPAREPRDELVFAAPYLSKRMLMWRIFCWNSLDPRMWLPGVV